MTACVNKIILVGYLGKDPSNDSPKAAGLSPASLWLQARGGRLTTANESSAPSGSTWSSGTGWPRVCKTYLGKGSRVYLEGRLQSRSYETENGKQRTLEVVANVVKMLDSAKKGDSTVSKKSEAALDNDELPVFEGDCA